MSKLLSVWGTIAPNRKALVDEKVDRLYEEAKRLYQDGFAVVLIDAANVPEELLGEIVELTDLFYPREADEPLFDVAGVSNPIPMSALTTVQ